MKKFLITSIVINHSDSVEHFGVLADTGEIPSNAIAYPRVNGTEVVGSVAKLQPVIVNEYIDAWIADNNVEEVKVEAFGSIEDHLHGRQHSKDCRWFLCLKGDRKRDDGVEQLYNEFFAPKN